MQVLDEIDVNRGCMSQFGITLFNFESFIARETNFFALGSPSPAPAPRAGLSNRMIL